MTAGYFEGLLHTCMSLGASIGRAVHLHVSDYRYAVDQPVLLL